MSKPYPPSDSADPAVRDLFGFDLEENNWFARVRLASSEAASAAGRLGEYELLGEVQRGGQGVVFRARQPRTGRELALKRISAGAFASEDMRARFAREIAVIARLDHPNVVTVYGSEIIDGQPVLAMQWIEGVPFDEWAAPGGQARPVREILGVFVQICDAVLHAHQRGVIHRDLKPSNILIDRAGRARVLDFGLAKLYAEAQPDVLATQSGVFIGTPAYAPPELAAGRHADVDVRSDVYQLGAVLYQALTGRRLFAGSSGFQELLRDILERVPERPSRVSPRINRELDAIILKALSKDKEQRYASVEGLRQDVQRYLGGYPVLAHPPSRIYRTRKFVRKHWLSVGVVTAFAALLAVFSGALWVRFQHEKLLAQRNGELFAQSEQRLRDVQTVAEFQSAQLSDIDVPGMGVRLRADLLTEARAAMEHAKLDESQIASRSAELEKLLAGANLTNVALKQLERDIFDRALNAIDEKFADQPIVQGRLFQSIADTLRDVGLLDRAIEPQIRALALSRSAMGEEHPETLAALNSMASLLAHQGKFAEAEKMHRETLMTRRRVLGDDAPATLESMSNLGVTLKEQGKLSEAEQYCRESLEKRRRLLGPRDRNALTSMSNMALLQVAQGKLAEAESYLREVLEIRRADLGDEHRDTLGSLNNLGTLLKLEGKLAEAEPYVREAVASGRRTLGDDHPQTLTSLNNLGSLLHSRGAFAEAEECYRESLERRRRILGDDHPDTLLAINNLGGLFREQGKLAEAESYLRDSLEKHRRIFGEDHPRTLTMLNNFGALLQLQGKLPQAELCFRESAEKQRRLFGEDHPGTLLAMGNLGNLLQRQGKLSEAEPYLREALEKQRRVLGEEHPNTLQSINSLGYLLYVAGRLAEAEPYSREAVEKFRRVLGDAHPSTLNAVSNLASVLQRQGRLAEAEPYFRLFFDESARAAAVGSAPLAGAEAQFAAFLLALGSPAAIAEAERLLRDCVAIRERALPDEHPQVWLRYNAMSLLGTVLAQQCNFTEAESMLLAGYNGLKDDPRVPPPSQNGGSDRRREALTRIVELYERWNETEPSADRTQLASEWRALLINFAEKAR
jgi:eukaryotic-like serine/threonine-protein kinase